MLLKTNLGELRRLGLLLLRFPLLNELVLDCKLSKLLLRRRTGLYTRRQTFDLYLFWIESNQLNSLNLL